MTNTIYENAMNSLQKVRKSTKIYLKTLRSYREGGRTVGSGVVKEIIE